MERAGATGSVTRNDVARLAGVSSAVVSYVINNGPRPVAPATRQRVLDAIDKLGYQPNAAARSLITGRADLLGLIVPDIRNPYFASLAQAAEEAASQVGVNLVLGQADSDTVGTLVESLRGHLVSGIITAIAPDAASLTTIQRAGIPLVSLSLIHATEHIALRPDYVGGAQAAVNHLITVHGHTRIGLVIGSDHPESDEGPVDGREVGWRTALEAAGLTTRHLIRAHWSATAGREAATRLMTEHPDVTAVFVSSDLQTMGLISGLRQSGRSVPDDLALMSFDGSPEAEFMVPPVSTVRVPLGDMARAAFAAIGGELSGPQTFPTSLILRESCGCPPDTASA